MTLPVSWASVGRDPTSPKSTEKAGSIGIDTGLIDGYQLQRTDTILKPKHGQENHPRIEG